MKYSFELRSTFFSYIIERCGHIFIFPFYTPNGIYGFSIVGQLMKVFRVVISYIKT